MLVGALSTIPLAFEVFSGRRRAGLAEWPESAATDPWYGSTESFRQRGVSVPS